MDKSPKKHFLNSLKTIGWSDPFPKDSRNVDGSFPDAKYGKVAVDEYDLIYPEGRYIEDQVPFHLYIPKREIMFKLMRACIDINQP